MYSRTREGAENPENEDSLMFPFSEKKEKRNERTFERSPENGDQLVEHFEDEDE